MDEKTDDSAIKDVVAEKNRKFVEFERRVLDEMKRTYDGARVYPLETLSAELYRVIDAAFSMQLFKIREEGFLATQSLALEVRKLVQRVNILIGAVIVGMLIVFLWK